MSIAMLWTVAIIVALLLLGTLLLSGLIFYLQFKRSPGKQWSERVLTAAHAASQQQLLERQRLQGAEQQHRLAVESLHHQAFDSYLATISVHELDHAPGIGPATVATLSKAGLRTLAALQQAVIALPGIGEKRLADIDAAVTGLTSKARQSFDAGHCPQAVALPRQLQELERRRQAERACIQARLRAAEDVGRQLEVRAVEARRVTFWNYLRLRFREQISEAELNTPLPNLGRAVEAADAAARRTFPPTPPVAIPATPPPRRLDRVPRRRPEHSVAHETRTESPAPQAVEKATAPVRAPMAALAAPSSPPDRSLEMMELTVQLLLAVARTDGRIADRERRLIEDHLRRRYHYDQALYNRAKVLCAHYETATIDMDRCLQATAELFSVPHRTALVQVACEVAATSGGVNARETGLLHKMCTRLGIAMPAGPSLALEEKPVSASPKLSTADSEEHWLAALEIEGGVKWTPDLVRRQYYLLTERYEPSKVHGMGPEFATMAGQKRAAVRAAAVALLGGMGLQLDEAKPAPPPADIRHNPDLDALFGG